MSEHRPSLMITVLGSDRKQSQVLAHVKEKLQRRGLKACVLKNGREFALGDCDILLVGCGETQVDLLAEQMEQLWMRGWNKWYAAVQERRSASDSD